MQGFWLGEDPDNGAQPISEENYRSLINDQTQRFVNGALVPYEAVVTSAQVNAERQRRIVAGKVIDGVHVTGTDDDARNLMSLALGAQMRLATGDNETLTTFRDGGNIDHDLTPAQLLSLWQQSASYVSDLYAASWALKAMEPIPADFTNDSYWPS